MIYQLSLHTVGIVAGAVLILIGLLGLLKPDFADLMQRFPRSHIAGVILLTICLIWTFWLVPDPARRRSVRGYGLVAAGLALHPVEIHAAPGRRERNRRVVTGNHIEGTISFANDELFAKPGLASASSNECEPSVVGPPRP